jgi:quinol monooxygenase YgiN
MSGILADVDSLEEHMIVTIAKQIIKKEYLPIYHILAEELAELSREEKGCISYYPVRSEDDERENLFIEVWENQEAIDYHVLTEHFTRIVPQFAKMFEETEKVSRYLLK